MAFEGKAMAQGDGISGEGVLRRLLSARNRAETGAGKAPQLPQPSPPTPARAGATAIGRAADRLYGLGVQPLSVSPGALTLAELPELLPQPALLAVLQGPGDLVGVIALCPEAVTALIEIQTMGRVTSRPVERRRLTRSDAMICADFINVLMAELATEMVGVEGFDAVAGYRYATCLDDPRPLTLMLEDRAYRSLAFDLRLGGKDTRDGRVFLALPQPAGRDRGAGPRPEAGTVAAPEPDAPDAAVTTCPPGAGVPLAEAMLVAPVELVGILCRKRMTLGELRALAPGRLLHLPRVSLSEARLETAGGQLLATGKFGEAEGCHAIRLHDPQAARQPAAAAGAPPPGSASLASQVDGDAAPIGDLHQPDAFRRPPEGAAAQKPETTVNGALPPRKAAGSG